MSFRVEFDWVEALPSTDRVAEATMAALTITVNGRCVTSVLDRRSRSCRDHVVTPLAYVAEWIVSNWWRLFHEVEDETPRQDFAEAHDLSLVGDGFLLPRLTIVPTQQTMRLRWIPYRPSHSDIEFMGQGEARVDRPDLEEALSRIVEAAQDRLDCNGLALDLLQQDWAAIQTMDDDEREFCRAAALLGEDPFAVAQPLADRIIDFWRCSEPAIREDALATANGAGLVPLAKWLGDALRSLGSANGGTAWAQVRDALPLAATSAKRPYQRGYDLARAVRAQLAVRTDRYEFSTTGPEALPAVEMRPPASRIHGVVAADSPACANAARGNAKRFLLARAVGDYVGRSAPGPAILSGLATERQAQTRAFAADFLAPEAALRKRLRRSHVYPDEVDDLALEFGVSSYVIRHQIENHGLATVTEW